MTPPSPRSILAGLGLLLLAIVLTVIAYRVLFLPGKARQAAADAVSADAQAEAVSGAAADSLTITNEVNRTITRIDEITRSNNHAIRSAADADTRAPAVAGALRDSLCLRDAYQDDPGCTALRGDAGGVGPAERDTGRAAAGE